MQTREPDENAKENSNPSAVTTSVIARNNGVLYIAFGVAYLAMTLVSFASLRKTNSSVNVHVVTNIAFDFTTVDGWDSNRDSFIFLDMPTEDNRKVKCALDQHTPFQRTIFLDCDTVVLKDLSMAWDLLDEFDIAIKQNANPQRDPRKADPVIFRGYRAGALPHWNSGVVLFRKNDKTRKFFERWWAAYTEGGLPFDQVALAKTILAGGSEKFLSLDGRWNCSGPTVGRKRWLQSAMIFHYTTMMTPSVISELRSVDRYLVRSGLTARDVESAIISRRMSRRKSLGFARYWLGELSFRLVDG